MSSPVGTAHGLIEPVSSAAHDPEATPELEGVGLCLSGGGYRAMLFHLGAIWRLNEIGYLPKIDRISSVSGGSITSGRLAVSWGKLVFTNGVASNFREEIVVPIRRLAGKTIDIPSVFLGWLGRGTKHHYQKALFDDATLQDTPNRPVFVFNASNVQSSVLVRFTKAYLWDWKVGKIPNPRISIADAVAASAAFPPVLSPFRLRVDPAAFEPGSGDELQRPPFTETMVLTDGGVYDNLGLETVWKRCKTVLVSDGGMRPAPEEHPAGNWLGHLQRIIPMIHNQVSSLRKRVLMHSFLSGDGVVKRQGAYWGTEVTYSDFPSAPPLNCPKAQTRALAATATRLAHMSDTTQERLINWGYAACAGALQSYVPDAPKAPAQFPYPNTGVGS